jgi:signal transduction histidine kinase/ActR/RegA family two-component response regulator
VQDQRSVQIALQKRMIDADTPRRMVAVFASGLLALMYLTPFQVVLFLGLYFPSELALMAALRRIADRPQSRPALLALQLAAFCNMSAYLLPAAFLWLEPAVTPKIGALLFVFGGMLSVMLVRSAFLPMTVANSLPLAALACILGYVEYRTADLRDQLFLTIAVSVLAGYFVVTLRNALRINRTLSLARDAALARVETQRRFLATMSHELRTPLNGILGMAQEINGSHPGIGAEVICDSARDMAVLVGDLLDNAAIEAGALRIKREPARLEGLVQRLEDRWLPAYKARGLVLSFDLSPDLRAPLMIDPLRLSQCLSNLLSNALRHTVKGGAALRIRPHALGLSASVTDSGPGLTHEMEAQLFQPFAAQALDAADSGPSTGLGLSICRGLARAMGGDLTFERPAEGGSRFVLTISAAPATEAPAARAETVASAPDMAQALQGKRILVVDDIATNRLVLRLMLRKFGCQCHEAASGEEALAILASATDAPVDLTLMDIRMPGLSGFETLARKRATGCQSPVIAVSADAAPDEQAEALAHGFDGYLTKPVEEEVLLALLYRVLISPPRQAL